MNNVKLDIKDPLVLILLSTFNGQNYLNVLLDSLINQCYTNYKLIIRDDGSTDNSLDIINQYKDKYPQKIVLDTTISKNMGFSKSFLYLLNNVHDKSYTMFCDQDDFWFPEKVRKFVNKISDWQTKISQPKPILVFGDMYITNGDNEIISDSFWEYRNLDLSIINDWKRVMVGSMVTGCSTIMNYDAVSLLKKANDLPIFHDHLAAILVAKYGILIPLHEKTMYYKQHDSNIEGAKVYGLKYLTRRLIHFAFKVFPRYIKISRAFNLPVIYFCYLKLESVFYRLTKNI